MNHWHHHDDAERYETALMVARGLGVFSIALGVAELLAPRRVTGPLGMEEETQVVRAYGAREIATGVAILAAEDPRPWVMARVAGDLLDLATLGYGLRGRNPEKPRIGVAMGLIAGITLVDAVVAEALGHKPKSRRWLPDYGDRSGFPRPVEAMRGAARKAWSRLER